MSDLRYKVTNASSLFVVERSTRSSSRCQGECTNKTISYNSVRIGKLGKASSGTKNYGTDTNMTPKWYHPSCLFDSFVTAKETAQVIESPEDFRAGWGSISAGDKKKLIGMIAEAKEKRLEFTLQPKKKKVKSNVRASESLVQAALPSSVWQKIFLALPIPCIWRLSRVSKLCQSAAKHVLFLRIGITMHRSSVVIPRFQAEIEKLTIEEGVNLSCLKHYPNLTSLTLQKAEYLSTGPMSEGDLLWFSSDRLSKVVEFNVFHDSRPTALALSAATHMPNLRSLHLSSILSSTTDEEKVLNGFSQITSLTSLSITPCDLFTRNQKLYGARASGRAAFCAERASAGELGGI